MYTPLSLCLMHAACLMMCGSTGQNLIAVANSHLAAACMRDRLKKLIALLGMQNFGHMTKPCSCTVVKGTNDHSCRHRLSAGSEKLRFLEEVDFMMVRAQLTELQLQMEWMLLHWGRAQGLPSEQRRGLCTSTGCSTRKTVGSGVWSKEKLPKRGRQSVLCC